MKTYSPLLAVATLVCLAFPEAAFARTANHILANPDQHHEKTVTVDVAYLRPVRWKSPVPEVAFFHAITYDKRAKSPGGAILLAFPESSRESMIRRYGVVRDGNARVVGTKPLRATLRNMGEGRRRGIWYLDQTEGSLNEALKANHAKIEQAIDRDERGDGPAHRPLRRRPG